MISNTEQHTNTEIKTSTNTLRKIIKSNNDREKFFKIIIGLDLRGKIFKNLPQKDILLCFKMFQFISLEPLQKILKSLIISDRKQLIKIEYAESQLEKITKDTLPCWKIQLKMMSCTTANAVNLALQQSMYDFSGNLDKWSITVEKQSTWEFLSPGAKFEISQDESKNDYCELAE